MKNILGGEMKKVFLIIFILAIGAAVMPGCGGTGPGAPGSQGSENTGVVVDITNVSHAYLNDNIDWQIDILQDDCNPDPAVVDPEPFGDDFAVFSFTGTPLNPTANPAPGDLHIETYSVEFFPVDPGTPPIERLDGFARFTIPSNGSASGLSLLIIDSDKKFETLNLLSENGGHYSPQRIPMQYDMKITLNGKNDHGEAFNEEFLKTVLLGYYNHCQ
jgi:hypothetical protein